MSTLPLTIRKRRTLDIYTLPIAPQREWESLPPKPRPKARDPETLLPVELWLDVLSHVPPASFDSISLVSRLFAGLARPFIFSKLKFHCFGLAPGIEPVVSPLPPHYSTRSEDRLRFVLSASPAVASLVRAVEVGPRPMLVQASALNGGDESIPLLDSVFRVLPQLTNLRSAHFYLVTFSQWMLDTVCALPLLSEMHVQSCTVETGALIRYAADMGQRLRRFKYEESESGPGAGDRDRGSQAWLGLVFHHAERLIELELSPLHLLFGCDWTEVDTPSFPNVTAVVLGWEPRRMSTIAFASLLSRFPSLQSLVVYDWGPLAPDDGPYAEAFQSNLRPIPTLRTLACSGRGMRFCLPFIPAAGTGTLEKLSIHPCNVYTLIWEIPFVYGTSLATARVVELVFYALPNGCNELVAILSLFQKAEVVDVMVVQERAVTHSVRVIPLLHPILLFAKLNVVQTEVFSSLFAQQPASEPTEEEEEEEEGEASNILWPPHVELRRLAIRFKTHIRSDPALLPMPDVDALRAGMLRRCPKMQALWLDGAEFIYAWKRKWPGDKEEEEIIASRFEDTVDVRTRFEAFWKG
ncbi:hypothetical protein MKEN_00838200 [Mycena kentingensis (nom. inval.)]|nr:hypothetical protein MKEN_00838200 [Mycena kentingensis (nom. inval.)]